MRASRASERNFEKIAYKILNNILNNILKKEFFLFCYQIRGVSSIFYSIGYFKIEFFNILIFKHKEKKKKKNDN